MKKYFPAFLVALGATFILLVVSLFGYGAWKIHSIFTLLEVDDEAIEAELAEYRDMTDELAKRPRDDFDALKKLLADMKQTFEGESPRFYDPCSKDLSQNLELYSSQKQEWDKIFNRLEPLLDGGIILPLDIKEGLYPEILSFQELRSLAYALFCSATYHSGQGDSELALDRLSMALTLTEGLGDCPNLIYLMVNVSLLQYWQQALVFNLPALDSDDLLHLKRRITEMPPVSQYVMLGLKSDMVLWIHSLESSNVYNIHELFEMEKPWLTGPGAHLFIPYFKFRERRHLLDQYSAVIRDYQDWFDKKDSSLPPHGKKYMSIWKSILFINVFGNVERVSMKAKFEDRTNKALLKAIEEELNRRETDGAFPIVIPIDEERKIVIDEKRGCIVKQGKEASDSEGI